MQQGQASRTAAGAAVLRANHYLHHHQPILADQYALAMTTPTWRRLLQFQPAVKLLNSRVLQSSLGLLEAQVILRSHYAEEHLLHAIAKGIQQYVIVGAGLDTSAIRIAQQFPHLKIFEVDHPDTQATKRQKLTKLGLSTQHIEFVAVNFERESIADALARSSYQPHQAGFFSWLGTTHYLTQNATLSTLKSIAYFAKRGSEVVLDYSIPYDELNLKDRLSFFALSRLTHFMGEPIIGMFSSSSLHHQLITMGYQIVEDISGQALGQRYQLNHPKAAHVLHLKIS